MYSTETKMNIRAKVRNKLLFDKYFIINCGRDLRQLRLLVKNKKDFKLKIERDFRNDLKSIQTNPKSYPLAFHSYVRSLKRNNGIPLDISHNGNKYNLVFMLHFKCL